MSTKPWPSSMVHGRAGIVAAVPVSGAAAHALKPPHCFCDAAQTAGAPPAAPPAPLDAGAGAGGVAWLQAVEIKRATRAQTSVRASDRIMRCSFGRNSQVERKTVSGRGFSKAFRDASRGDQVHTRVGPGLTSP